MKKLFAWFLVLAMCVSMFAACGQKPNTEPPVTQAPTQATEEPVATEPVDLSDPDGLAAALEYLRTIYKNAGGLSPKDFTRIGTVPVGAKKFEVVWTASVSEDLVKAVRGADGMVTIDVNEECDTETPYTLTATITDAAGNSVSYSWEHTLPASMSVSDVLDEAYALEVGASLPYEVTLTGVITDITDLYSEQYGNITVIMTMEGEESRPVKCYRLAGDGAKDLAIGDTITVTGTITNYNGEIEFSQGCNLDTRISGGGTPPGEKVYSYFWHLYDGDRVIIYNRDAKMALSSEKTGYYNKGVKLSKDENGKFVGYGPNEVWTVRFNGYSYSFIDADGNEMALDKEYSNLNVSSSYDEWRLVQISSTKYMIENVDRKGYFLEWYEKYSNFSTYNPASPEKDEQFIFSFYRLPEDEVVEEEEEITDDMVPVPVEDPEEGVAYKFTLFQNGLGQLLNFTGEMAGYYYGTSEAAADAVNVYLEKAEGGYHIYYMNGNDKTYLNVIPREGQAGKTNVVLQTLEANAAPSVYDLNKEFQYVSTQCEGITWYLGTYGGNVTISASDVKYIADTATIGVSQFTAWFTKLEKAEVEVELTVAEAIAMGSAMDHNTYTEEKYYVTGEITEIYNTQFGNMRIKDAEGNILTIYGTYSADGNTRFDAMETKPAVGDTVKLYGIIGQYSGTPQMKNGWIIEFGNNKLTVAEAIAMGAAMEHNVYTEDKYYVTGEITEVYNTQFGNMRIKDAEGNVLTIYGTWSADGNTRYDALEVKPVAGDTVELYGIIGQYNGTPQMKNGWIVAHTPAAGGEEGGEEPPVSNDPAADSELTIAEAIALGESKEHNTYTEDKYYVTGEITEVYQTTYGNMKIKDAEGNILTIYGTYSADGNVRYDGMEVKPVAGDTVKLYGIIGQYNGTAQMKNGWIIEWGNSELTVAEAIAMGSAMDHNTYTEDKYYVTGEITEVYQTTYGNMKIKDAEGNILTIYGTYSADGNVRYDGMEVKPVAGDTVKLYGIIGQYNGTAQMKNGWIVEHVPAAGGEEGGEEETPAATAVIDFKDIANRTVGTEEQQVWVMNGITVTNDKAASQSPVNIKYYDPIRCYQGSNLTVAFAGMVKIEITCSDENYAAQLQSTIGEGATVSGNVVTVVFEAAVDSFVVENLVKQVRIDSIAVYAA